MNHISDQPYNNITLPFCYCSSNVYAYTQVGVQHKLPAQEPAMTMVENVAYEAVLPTKM